MPTLTIKNLPEGLHSTLKQEAQQAGRSLNKEILHRLQNSLAVSPFELEPLLASVDALRSDGVKLSPELMTLAREQGRP